ncbi:MULTISPECIES: PqiC family protein [unclassified Neptuniibacter]|uniref:PqiC family protein n=1 Tax=unclassified Neptuniibacter TaxID=2630693 RepID=UPI000C405E57|nr:MULTISPECIES: PqiC family protein [unclassified Neptuniibacter]MAY43235.1 hypothetical protein [Oceanospirillaceae bacterium]|tara:strand:+ start:18775 stop:19383 length:609 start_codon:yes stop_codon:yes gene_type:complete
MKTKLIAYISLLISALLLSGCSQTIQPDTGQFYLLSSDSQANNKTNSAHVIGLRPVTVASYIDNPGIALQTSDNRIRIANHHLWAEEPNLAITRVLHGELNNLLSNSRVDNGQLGRNEDWQYILTTHVDQFHGTEKGLAVFSGYWRFESSNNQGNKVLINTRFNLSSPIEKPGYTALVAELRQLLSQLSEQQAEQIARELNE